MGILLLPIIVLIVVAVMLFTIIGSALMNVANGGSVNYDEQVFQQYADKRYAEEFSVSSAYEDNLLLVFLTNEEADGYYAIAWVGDNIRGEINDMFGDETTAFGYTVRGSINSEYYAYSLDSNLASVMEKMTDRIVALNLASSFRSQSDRSSTVPSHMTNHTELALAQATVDGACKSFTEATDIPVVIVVDTMENVFGKTLPIGDIIIVLLLVAVAVVAIVVIVKRIKNNKNGGGNNGGNNGGNYNGNNTYNNYNNYNNGYNGNNNYGNYYR